MKLRSNFKFHECDKRVVFRKVYQVVASIGDGYDIVQDGFPRMVLFNTRNERYGTDSIAGQLEDIAFHSREAMVRTCIDTCRHLSCEANETRLLVNGCYFLSVAILQLGKGLKLFPENQDLEGLRDEEPQRPASFYDSAFWGSSVVQAWLVVHSVYEWYALYMGRWAKDTAEKIVSGALY